MSAPQDDDSDATPLPPPDRESNLDMSVDIPAMPLSAVLADAPASTAEPVTASPIAEAPAIEDRYDPRVARPPTAPPAPRVITRAIRDLVWGVVLLGAGLVIAISTVLGAAQTGVIIASLVPIIVGIVRLARGAHQYDWSAPESDLWEETATLIATEGALPALALVTLLMVYIYAGVFGGELVGDDLSFHMAESRRIADCIAGGDFDFWNPSANGGFASAYYYQVIPQLASAIPTAVFGHFLFFFQLSVFLPLVLAPAIAYRGMRLMGATPWQALFAAAVVGLMNGESRWGTGNAGTFRVGLYTQTWALAAFPLSLGHAIRWVSHGKGLAPAIAWGAFVFLCHPFAGIALALAVIIGMIGSLVMRLFDLWFAQLANRSPRAWVLVLWIGGMIVCPVLLLVFLGYLAVNFLGRDDDRFARVAASWRARWTTPPVRVQFGKRLSFWKFERIPGVVHLLRGVTFAFRWAELRRAALLGVALLIAWMPIWLPLLIDKVGFGGFPHRVNDEVGPGFTTLGTWWIKGEILDYGSQLSILTWVMPVVFLLARATVFRWLWWPALFFALLLGLGPHLGTTQNDLFPAVRFLGAMQITLALGIGSGVLIVGRYIWRAEQGSLTMWATWFVFVVGVGVGGPLFARYLWNAPPEVQPMRVFDAVTFHQITNVDTLRIIAVIVIGLATVAAAPIAFFWMRSQYAIRTGLAAVGAALAVILVIGGSSALKSRITTMPQYKTNHRNELMAVVSELEHLPQGRKQVGPGAENHWWNLLTYVYARRPALLQMGGGGLQASPNYDFLWNNAHEYAKNAWLYDAPYLVVQRSSAATMPPGDSFFKTENFEIRKLDGSGSGIVSPITVTGLLPPGDSSANTPTRKAALAWMKTNAPLEDKMLAYEGSGPVGPSGNGRVLRAWRQDSPGDDADIVAEVEVVTPMTFVARESWHPRWHVYIDDVEARVRRVTPDFPAVDVAAGKHTITFRFERPWWAWACWLTWPGMTLLAWYAMRRLNRSNLPRARVV